MKELTLETERLLLRPFRLGDEAQVLQIASNPEVVKYTGDVIRTTMEEMTDLITNVWLSDYTKYGYGRLAVLDKKTATIIGFNGIKYLPELSESDLGYRFLPEYWGKGIATESSRAVLKYAFGTLRLKKIMGFTLLENHASTSVLKKLGFTWFQLKEYPGEEGVEPPVNWFQLTEGAFKKNSIERA
ncbi:MAG: GNAT family N-acetyltransferase [Marinirhabdus sp.]